MSTSKEIMAMTHARRFARLTVLALLVGLTLPALAQAQDPAAIGSHGVTRQEYTQGDTVFTPTGFPGPVEFTGVVHYPTDLINGPYPLVLYLHGRHQTCGTSTLEWPCTGGRLPIKNFIGYDYSANQLASHGYIVISISANGINARDNSVTDLGAFARAQLIDRHLEYWRTLNTVGAAPFGALFVGRVDLTRVGTMGHSRGGEGIARHVSLNAAKASPFPLRVLVPIAPTNFSRFQVNNTFKVAQILSYCDGDVSDLQGVHFYDDARFLMTTSGYQQYINVMGGNHNFYNSIWTNDDWLFQPADPFCSVGGAMSARLTAAQQRAVGTAYLATYFRTEVGGEPGFFGYIDGSTGKPPTVSALAIHASYQGNNTQRRDLNRLLTNADLTTNFLGGATSQTGLTPHDLCGGLAPQPLHCLAGSTARQPHTTPSARSTMRGMSQLRTGWNATTATFVHQIPAGPSRDISAFDFFQFRAVVNFTDGRNPVGAPRDLVVRFTDALGAVQSLRVGMFSGALYYPPGVNGPVPKALQNVIRLPLSALTTVNKTQIREVAFLFNQQATGALLISEISFYNKP